MLIITAIIIFILGLVFGSFGSVLLARLEKFSWPVMRSVLTGRSECVHCKKTLKPLHLVPLWSFLTLKRQSACCGKSIPRKYFILELWSGIIFLGTYLVLHFFVGDFSRWYLAFWLALNRFFWLLIVFDMEKLELHVPVWIFSVALVLLPQFFGGMGDYRWAFAGSLLFGGFFYGLYFFAKWYVRKRYKTAHEWIGEGDAMLAFVIGASLPLIAQTHGIALSGWFLAQMLMLFLILSSGIGLVWTGLTSLFSKTKQKLWNKNTIIIPFIPAMIVAFWVLWMWSEKLLLLVFPSLW